MQSSHPTLTKWSIAAVFLLLLSAMTAVVAVVFRDALARDWYPGSTALTVGIDWKMYFRPAALAMLSGQSPYLPGIYTPPWTFLPLLPLALLPETLGAAGMFVLGLACPVYAAVRAGARPPEAIALMLSPWILANASNGNFDWLVMIGTTLPPRWGLFFLAVKPQLGAGLALFWIVEAFRRGGLREVIRTIAPVTIAFALSLVLYGLWPLRMLVATSSTNLNTSLGWMGAMVGLVLLVYGLRTRQATPTLISTPFISPYMTGHSWGITLFALLNHRLEFWVAWAALWAAAFHWI